MSKEKDDVDIELPADVIDRVNIGVVAVSLSLYEEGMDLDELCEVTGIRKDDVMKSLDFLNAETYRVSNFKKMLQFLISSGMVFPLGDQISKKGN
ncbi:MAG: hypothetical protein ACTSP3_09555 [Candidatus Heimdallarchaeaceae archaeon]